MIDKRRGVLGYAFAQHQSETPAMLRIAGTLGKQPKRGPTEAALGTGIISPGFRYLMLIGMAGVGGNVIPKRGLAADYFKKKPKWSACIPCAVRFNVCLSYQKYMILLQVWTHTQEYKAMDFIHPVLDPMIG